MRVDFPKKSNVLVQKQKSQIVLCAKAELLNFETQYIPCVEAKLRNFKLQNILCAEADLLDLKSKLLYGSGTAKLQSQYVEPKASS